MTEELALKLAQLKAQELHYDQPVFFYKELWLNANQQTVVDLTDGFMFLVSADSTVDLKSVTGNYNYKALLNGQNEYFHYGRINVRNAIGQRAKLTYIEVLTKRSVPIN
jgi:hypothetical protein